MVAKDVRVELKIKDQENIIKALDEYDMPGVPKSSYPLLSILIIKFKMLQKHGCQAYTVDREPQKQVGKIASDRDSLPCVLVAERAGTVTVPTKNKKRTKRNQSVHS